MKLFWRKNKYLIQWERSCYTPHEQHETVVSAKCEADAVWKFLQGHNPIIEQLEILKVKMVHSPNVSVV